MEEKGWALKSNLFPVREGGFENIFKSEKLGGGVFTIF